ncbi:hypothetical protein K458DRAFT_419874 [Lentithecium fluviatile CBS 122367]|uniref:Uncharacterized protein n=1 Tax=Lentithecium fluviatile CBS 122367 TaxID=1168545 RepID=A0A6G1IWY8_9PLEO|nr:hypothetical protein K458DRAFT_419874 [Lentithecium fluviatile CBS 122367]
MSTDPTSDPSVSTTSSSPADQPSSSIPTSTQPDANNKTSAGSKMSTESSSDLPTSPPLFSTTEQR